MDTKHLLRAHLEMSSTSLGKAPSCERRRRAGGNAPGRGSVHPPRAISNAPEANTFVDPARG